MTPVAAPSSAIEGPAWAFAVDALIDDLRDLIRIPSVNPPSPDAARRRAAASPATSRPLLAELGLEPEVVEPEPGRGSVHVRLRGDGTGGEPFLLLSHLDVVPAPPDRWTHDPFAADIADGYVYGRGAVDMKAMVAMELGVVRLLAAEARAAGLDPARDPIPGLRRDVLFTCTADEEAGGLAGAKWVAENRPEWLRAAGAVNECGGVSTTIAGRRLYPIQVAEKGFAAYRIAVRGTWGHGSMPREDNAAVLAAAVIERLAVPGPTRVTPVMARFLEQAAAALPDEAGTILDALVRRRPGPRRGRARGRLRPDVRPGPPRAAARHAQPGRRPRRDQVQRHPGRRDRRGRLPGAAGHDRAGHARDQVLERLGPELAAACEVELIVFGAPVEAPAEGALFDLLAATIRDHDPDGIPLPVMAPVRDRRQAHRDASGTPTYGFSPLRLDPDERFLERFHGVDERVSIDALRWGLPVLYDVVRRFCS